MLKVLAALVIAVGVFFPVGVHAASLQGAQACYDFIGNFQAHNTIAGGSLSVVGAADYGSACNLPITTYFESQNGTVYSAGGRYNGSGVAGQAHLYATPQRWYVWTCDPYVCGPVQQVG